MAETKKEALIAFDAFVETYGVKYDKAVACLAKDRDALLAFYDFPAEHWKHLRTTNPIESTFATIRHRTVRSKGCLSNKTALAMVFKLAQAAEKSWRRLDGHHHLPKVIRGVTFTDGIEDVSRRRSTRCRLTPPVTNFRQYLSRKPLTSGNARRAVVPSAFTPNSNEARAWVSRTAPKIIAPAQPLRIANSAIRSPSRAKRNDPPASTTRILSSPGCSKASLSVRKPS